jgi:kynurenine formamidase
MAREYEAPSADEVAGYIRERNNWGRWGADDEVGAINLITPQKRIEAARLVRSGRAVSLSRDVPTRPGPGNPNPAQHWIRTASGPDGGGGAVDYYGMIFHGYVMTHVDALCHVWDGGGMWNGRDPQKEVTSNGARFGAIQHWRDGIATRGVLLDVPRFRGTPHVTIESPVHADELDAICAAQGVSVGAGDAICVYSGRESWQQANPGWSGYQPPSPGLHASCLRFLRDRDVSVLVWDLMDAAPNEYGIPWSVHAAIFAYGVALVDNALLQPLADVCAAEQRYEFMLTLAPLPVFGGTGSPVNPIALF